MRIGSLCTGYGGLDMAVQSVIGGTVAWVADIDPGAAALLAYRHPEVPNLGDLTIVDWSAVEPIEVLTAGYPCQPFSLAGNREGEADERHLWPFIAEAVRVLRPRLVVLENVAGHRSLGFGRVLGDLAEAGFDAEWTSLLAADVDATHPRERVFIAAQDADRAAGLQWWRAASGQASGRGPRPDARRRGDVPAADADGQHAGAVAAGDRRGESAAQAGDRGAPVSDALGVGRGEGRAEPAGQQGRPDAAVSSDEARFGKYAPTIGRWTRALGRTAPDPTEPNARGGRRLAAPFAEWMMGVPAGHVTGVPGLSRNQQIHLLGNGVVPQQGAQALCVCLDRWDEVAA